MPVHLRIRLQWQFKDEARGVLARHSPRNYEEDRTSSRGVREIVLPGDALSTPGMNAGARRGFRSLCARRPQLQACFTGDLTTFAANFAGQGRIGEQRNVLAEALGTKGKARLAFAPAGRYGWSPKRCKS
jgi:hypothetical protein